jgi:hypothetical protein
MGDCLWRYHSRGKVHKPSISYHKSLKCDEVLKSLSVMACLLSE